MPINILMPALSPTMTEGTLAKWMVKEGDEVASGDILAEIETDKATMEVEAVDEGRVGKIVVPDGSEGVAVNAVIAVLLEEGEDASDIDAAASSAPVTPPKPTEASAEPAAAPAEPTPAETTPAKSDTAPAAGAGGGERIFASPLARRLAGQAGIELAALSGSGPHGRIVKRDVEAATAAGVTGGAAGAISPLAESMARQAGLSLDGLRGSGPGGRIEKQDVEAALASAASGAKPAAKAAKPAAAPSGPGAREMADLLGMEYRIEALSMMRKTIARRLTESKQSVPHFYLTVECEIDKLLALRKDLNGRSDAYKISVNDFVIRAVALSLKKVPAANASFDPEGLLYYEHADVSVAVATPEGLITPIVKAAENKGLAAISREMKDLALRARDGKLQPKEYQGGTFSISNLGMFGVKEFSAVINPPQGCILAVGAGEQRAVVKDGALAVATVMSCTLSVDHRVVDGAVGAEFLAAFKALIEEPLTMLL